MFEVTPTDQYVLVKVTVEKLDAKVAATFKDDFTKIIDDHNRFVILDLCGVDFIDSSGLAAVVYCFKLTGIKDELAICASNERVLHLFKLTRLHDMINIYGSVDEAIAALK
ncbi:Anti-sigma factor antagonist [Sulfidibacter corallicola]|uniref:Anti-sigma factor antagonist n=1 Tax=Sulfidibacter corallicola TaxID=2818388 RepID=A0A8A4TY11_SULCO|nr:STAS domain-containing protein [Sulfidibacter corallicola]QTD53852.1 STAS domain-containing protein [Sulfidibacter corallicola]